MIIKMFFLLTLVCFNVNLLNSSIYSFKKGAKFEKTYSNYIQKLNENNQFECYGRYFYHNYKNRSIDSSLFSGVIIRDENDSLFKRSYLIEFDNKLFYYNKYQSFIFDKNNKTLQYDRATNSIKRINREIKVQWNIFHDFIDKSHETLERHLDTNNNNKFMYDSDGSDHFFIYNKYMDKYGFNWVTREKFTKDNYYPTYFYMNINEYTKLPRFEEWFVDKFEMKKDIDTSKINFEKYINQYPIYEEFTYKKKTCSINDKVEGNLVFDENLTNSKLKLVAFYKEAENLDTKLLEEDLNSINKNIPRLIYKFENDSLKLQTKEDLEIDAPLKFSEYNLNVMPCYYILDENNKIIKYFYGYNNSQRINFNDYLKEFTIH